MNSLEIPQLVPDTYKNFPFQRDLKFRRPLNFNPSSQLINNSNIGFFLDLNDSDLITKAAHFGYSQMNEIVADIFCELVIGLPIQEAAEHGLLRLYQSLGGDFIGKNGGLLIVESQAPVFKDIQNKIRALHAQHMNANTPQRNTWSDPIPSEWQLLPPSEKLIEARKLLQLGASELNIRPDLEITEIKNSTRFVITFSRSAQLSDPGPDLIRLEVWMRRKAQLPIELQLESTEDRNRRVQRTGRGQEA